MSRILENLLDMKHRVEKYVEPIQEQVTAWADEIDPASKSVSEVSVIKQIPRVNKSMCSRSRSTCDVSGLCEKLCPAQAISFSGADPQISDACIDCGICVAVCPNEAIVSYVHTPQDIFDRVGRSSALYNTAYITCEHAQDTPKADNVYVVPCLGDITRAEWSFIMNAYENVSLYIPEGLCTRCQVHCGEVLYRTQILEAEKSGMYPLGLVRQADMIDTRLKPHLEREELAVSVSKNQLEAKQRTEALEKIGLQKRAFRGIEASVIDTYGKVSIQGQARRLANWKKFDLLSSLLNENAAQNTPAKYPVLNPELCTGCTQCARACPQGACEVDRRGNFHLADTLCVGCGACVGVCEESALAIICEHF